MTDSMLLYSNADANPPTSRSPTAVAITQRPETPARRPVSHSGGVQ